MKIIRFISGRYLFSRKHVSLISVLTSISIAGITLGTALLIVVLSVFNGFYEIIHGYLLSIDPDIRIERVDQPSMMYDEELFSEVETHPEVEMLIPYVKGKSMLVFNGNRNEVVEVQGLERGSHIRIDELENSIQNGVFDLSVQDNRPGVVVSETLMGSYALSTGDEVAMLSTSGMRRALTQFSAPRVSRFHVRGSYSIPRIIEGEVVYIDMAAAQRLFNMQNEITGFELRLTDTDRAETVKRDLESMLGESYHIQTWYDLQRPLYDVMAMEKWGAYFILMIIVFVAMLNIIGSLTMIVIQKKKDIGVLISMGMTPRQIKKVFLSQGIQIGLIGCVIGGILGILLSLAQKEFGLLKLASSIIDAFPVSINALDIAIVLGGSMILCILASWYPAIRAAAIEPADAVRNE
ncbi:MAG: ABC transporter permease [Balneolaceae bacterium]